MESTEYLAFIPLLLYGIALADLLGEWKRFFDPDTRYLPYLLMTLVLTETAVYNVYIYLAIVKQLGSLDYVGYLSFLFPPFAFLMAVNSFTPDKEVVKTKEYFVKRMPIFFSLIAIFVATHFFYFFGETIRFVLYYRIILILVMLIAGFTRKIWLVYLFAGMWFVTFLIKIKIIAG